MVKQKRLWWLAVSTLAATLHAAPRPNIVLITLGSARADRMGFLAPAGKLTPNLNSLAPDSLIFEHAYAQAPSTVVSHATILTGTYPQNAQVSELGALLPPALPYLPDLLHARGYRTAAFAGSIALDPRNGLAQGFERGFDVYDAGFHGPDEESRAPSIQRSGAEVVNRALAWISKNSRTSFFLWVQLNDADTLERSSYDPGMRAADAAAGKLLAFLRVQKLYADAVIVVTADHGESLGAHGEETNGIFLYDETIRVPLMLKMPGGQLAGKRISTRARLVDVAPTILEAAGAGVPPEMQGQSLLRMARSSSAAEQPAYSRSDLPQQAFGWSGLESWRAGKYLYIRAPQPELYDLSIDPGATHNLAGTSRAVLDAMAGQLEAFDGRFRAGKAVAALSSSEMQKLASLGYVGLQKQTAASASSSGLDPKDRIATANKLEAALRDLEAGLTEKALAASDPIAAKQPDLYLAQYISGVSNLRKQQYGRAGQYLHRAIELYPDSPWAHYYMGENLLRTGDFKTAAVHLEIACGRLPDFAPGHASLAQAYERTGRSADAGRERARAAQLRGP